METVLFTSALTVQSIDIAFPTYQISVTDITVFAQHEDSLEGCISLCLHEHLFVIVFIIYF